MNRRTFLLGTLGVVAVGSAAYEVSSCLADQAHLVAAREALLAHFDYLLVDRATADMYVRAYDAHIESLLQLTEYPDRFYTGFLLATDFFEHEDESRPLVYRRLFDPYISPCYNPFTRYVT